ncbi:MAG TPA: DNA-processing protein DprA [Gammaproteobacteria bacterium]|nr:DNA-processing protein DprA [Gammaproteobacteria bacterium]
MKYWLALQRTPGVGPATILALLERYKEPRVIFDSPGERAASGLFSQKGLDYLANPDWAAVERDLAWLAEPNHHLITLSDPRYPKLLREIADPPAVLYVIGDPDLLSAYQLGIVGSRNPTPGGSETAHAFASYLTQSGLIITSGLALGVDAAAHRGALEAGGKTIAVAGTGLDRVYPARHRELAHEIAGHGALISEFPLGTPALALNFPRRNRIISGLSLGVLVVEAAVQSGSLITARLAAEQGREVFAIPGSIHNPLARGCHALIRQGAKLVETVADILEELGPIAQVTADVQGRAIAKGSTNVAGGGTPEAAPARQTDGVGNITSGLSVESLTLLDCLGFDPTPVDSLIERSGLTPEAVSSMLLVLELQGHVVSAPGGHYTRVTKRV